MKTVMAFGFCFVYLTFSNAQHDWVKGSVVLKSNQVLVGDISRKPIHELILVNCQYGMKALPCEQVVSYRFYDEASNINRQFISVKMNDLVGSSRFFEIVVQGEVKVVRRYHKRTELEEIDEARDFDYFAYIENGLIPLSSFKHKILPQLQEKYPVKISIFISLNKLPLQSMKSALLIIKHFNAITKTEGILAQAN